MPSARTLSTCLALPLALAACGDDAATSATSTSGSTTSATAGPTVRHSSFHCVPASTYSTIVTDPTIPGRELWFTTIDDLVIEIKTGLTDYVSLVEGCA